MNIAEVRGLSTLGKIINEERKVMKLQFTRVAGVFAASAAMTFIASTATAETKGLVYRWDFLDCDTVLAEGAPEGKERKEERCKKLEARIPDLQGRLDRQKDRLTKLKTRLDKAIEKGKSEEKVQKVLGLMTKTEERIAKLSALLNIETE